MGKILIDFIDLMKSMGTTTITVSERLRSELVKLAAELQMKVGRKVDYEDVIRYLISKHGKNAKLLGEACAPVGVLAKSVRIELRRGRAEDRRKEDELERRYS
jgi:hypothetical protein